LINGYALLAPSPGYREDLDYTIESAIELPDAIIELALANEKQKRKAERAGDSNDGRIKDGQRNDTLTSLAGTMRRRGMSYEAILAALLEENKRCDPPLDDREVETIARSVSGYDPAPVGENLTDLGNAARFERIHSGKILYCAERCKWVFWDGGRWQYDITGRNLDFAKEIANEIAIEADRETDQKRREELQKHASQCESRKKIDDMRALAKEFPRIRFSINQFDRNPKVLNVGNVTIDLETSTPRKQRAEDYITKIAGTTYDPSAQCPRWERFIDEVTCGDTALAGFLQRAVGYSLTGLTTEQCFFIMYGTGSNGKSKFIDTILRLLGDYGGGIKTSALLEGDSTADYHLAEQVGRRFVVAAEPDLSKRMASSLVKQATGQDLLPARRPFEKPFSYYPEFKLWLSTNERPRIDDPSDAMWRRIYPIPFNAKWVKAGETTDGYDWPIADENLLDKLLAELPGILIWALIGCIEWQKRGLNPPACVLEARREYREQEDTIGAFLADCCDIGETLREETSELFNRYTKWTTDRGEKNPMSIRAFTRKLAARGFRPERTMIKRYWRGLKLKPIF
jgi:putative DNA primase/helicase